jgi:hypothetical protein
MHARLNHWFLPRDGHDGVHHSCLSKGNKISKLTSFVVLAFGLLFFPGLAPADEAGPIAACAQRDLQASTTIETHGAAQDVAARGLYGAAVAQQLARSACREGHTDEALALYDLIVTLDRPAPSEWSAIK